MHNIRGKTQLICLGLASFILLTASSLWVHGSAESNSVSKRISIEWKGGRPAGRILVSDGTLEEVKVVRGRGELQGSNQFSSLQEGTFRLELQVKGTGIQYGKGGTVVTVATKENPFSFFLRDVDGDYPIYLPAYGVVVTRADDMRSYQEIGEAIHARGLQTNLQRLQTEPEESYEAAVQSTRVFKCETWLGLSRDMRLFVIDERLESIQPKFAGTPVTLPEAEDKPVSFGFLMGRGWGVGDVISRRMEDGVLPILHGKLVDDEITYELTAFVTLERTPLSPQTLRGTHFLVADGYGAGHTFSKEQKAQFDSLLPAEMNRDEETVLCLRITAVNTAPVPRYAFFRNATPNVGLAAWGGKAEWSFDARNGFGVYQSGRVFSVSKLNGMPLTQEEVAIQLRPGESANLEVYLPHRPISQERALRLAKLNFAERHQECRAFWKRKLEAGAQISVPDPPLNEMIQSGLLQMDLILYGQEPGGPLAPSIGIYNSIGVYSDKTIEFMDSMGWHDVARRALAYFLDKQRDDGFMQNFDGYMAETGAVLADLGEHYRYTHDDQWVKQIAPKVNKSCEFILRWRERNRREELRGKGYGLLEGRTADPPDPYHSFLLNGYAYLGLSRAAEMMGRVDPVASARWKDEAASFKDDIRAAFFDVMAKSPVVPLGDGSWCPTAPPWVESRGALVLYADGGRAFTHGAMPSRDSLVGPLYLVVTEVMEPKELATTFMLDFHNELMTKRNVAFSQPYLSRHGLIHLWRGEVKAFLKEHYNLLASISDRETHTWHEHFFGGSPHSVDGVNWFLMDTRSMLYLEKGDTLDLLPGIPRRYLEDGKHIELKKVVSYFGPLSLRVDSKLSENRIEAIVECDTDRAPKTVTLRLPHPEGRKATWVKGGTYDPHTERVTIAPFSGRAQIVLGFGESN